MATKNKKKGRTPSNEALRKGYENRGKYPDQGDKKLYTLKEINTWNCTEKAHKVRVLPVHTDDELDYYGIPIFLHRDIGVNGDLFLCLKKMKKGPCPVCEHQATLWETDAEVAKQLFPQMKYLIWLVDLDENPDKTQLWSCPKTAMDDILGASYKRSTDEIVNIADPEEGPALYFDRIGKMLQTRYKNFQLDDEPTPVKDSWMEAVLPFDEVLLFASYEEMHSAYFGTVLETETEPTPEPETEPVVEEKVETEPETSTEPIVGGNVTNDVNELDRDQLEELAAIHLIDDYELEEIEDMGTKKLRRLLNDALSKVEEPAEPEPTPESEPEPEPVDEKQSLRERLRNKVK